MLDVKIAGYRLEAHSPERPRYGSRLLLLHGLWTGASLWRHFGSFLAHRGWEVLAADLRGRPGSRPADVSAVRWQDYEEDASTLVRGVATEAPPIVIGHDAGAILALGLAFRGECRAAVALAPWLRPALTGAGRRLLGPGFRFWKRTVPAPRGSGDPAVSLDDSAAVVRDLARGRSTASSARATVPIAIVAGRNDPYLASDALAREATSLGAAFLEREAGHWDLASRGFERQVDLVHRWIVNALGGDLLLLSGYEDIEEDED